MFATKSRKYFASSLMVAGLGIALAGCGSSTPTATPPSRTSVTLVGGIQTEPTWWLPIVPVSFNSTSNGTTGLLWHPLLFINGNGTIDYARSIAKSVTPSQNDTVYTVQLSSKWHWSDGRPITAADAAYSWAIEAASAAPHAPWADAAVGSTSFDSVKSMVATGPSTLVVTVNKPLSPVYVELNILNYATPIPKFVWDKHSNMTKELSWMMTVGGKPSSPEFKVIDGPYFEKKFVHDQYWEMQANPKYSGHKPTIKTLVYEYETSSSNLFAQLRKGNFATTTLPSSFSGSVKQLTSAGYRTVSAGYVYSFNLVQPNYSSKAPAIGGLFNQLYFRQAMQMGINEPGIAQHFYKGFAIPDYTPMPRMPQNRFYDPAVKGYAYNPAAGKKLLEKHGWHLVNGVMERHGVKLEFNFLYMSGSSTDTNIAQYLKSTWAQEGIDVHLVSQPFTQLIDVVTNPKDAGKWTLAWWGAGWYTGPSFPFLSPYLTGSAYNFGGYHNSHLDALVHAAYQPGTSAQLTQRLDAYQVYAAQQLPVLFLPEYIGVGSPAPYRVIKTWLHGVVRSHQPSSGGSEPWRWTISP